MLGKFTPFEAFPDHITIDIETVDPYLKTKGASWVYNEGCILGISCKIDNLPTEYYPLRHIGQNYDYTQVKNYFYNLFSYCHDTHVPIVLHHGYYDLGWLQYEGFIDIGRCPPIRDT